MEAWVGRAEAPGTLTPAWHFQRVPNPNSLAGMPCENYHGHPRRSEEGLELPDLWHPGDCGPASPPLCLPQVTPGLGLEAPRPGCLLPALGPGGAIGPLPRRPFPRPPAGRGLLQESPSSMVSGSFPFTLTPTPGL